MTIYSQKNIECLLDSEHFNKFAHRDKTSKQSIRFTELKRRQLLAVIPEGKKCLSIKQSIEKSTRFFPKQNPINLLKIFQVKFIFNTWHFEGFLNYIGR